MKFRLAYQKFINTGFVAVVAFLMSGCMKWDYGDDVTEFDFTGKGLIICNEGNFQYSNATLSYYDPATGEVENELFFRANGFRLGDVAQSLTVKGNKGWIVVNNSHVIFAVDLKSFREQGRVENLPSPRYIHFIDDRKAYVTQLWDNRIVIIDPTRYEVTGYITVPDMSQQSGSTEQMVSDGKNVYCTCWSYQNRVIRIDSSTDRVTGSLVVGIQPSSIALDCNGKLWVLTDGGYQGSPYGYERPSLLRIDAATFSIERRFELPNPNVQGSLVLNAAGDTLYWINDDCWRMDVGAVFLPSEPFLESKFTKFYNVSVSPYDGDVYIADAIDYQQQGMIYRYSQSGELKDSFYVGVTPSGLTWK